MSNIFKSITSIFSPDVPKVQTYVPPPVQPVTVPTADNSAEEQAKAAEEEAKKRATQKGRAATILSSNSVMGDDSGVATKKLLGK